MAGPDDEHLASAEGLIRAAAESVDGTDPDSDEVPVLRIVSTESEEEEEETWEDQYTDDWSDWHGETWVEETDYVAIDPEELIEWAQIQNDAIQLLTQTQQLLNERELQRQQETDDDSVLMLVLLAFGIGMGLGLNFARD